MDKLKELLFSEGCDSLYQFADYMNDNREREFMKNFVSELDNVLRKFVDDIECMSLKEIKEESNELRDIIW